MLSRTAAALALPVLALLALTGCTPGGGPGGGADEGTGGARGGATDEPGDGTGSDSGLGPVLTDCVNGDWHADLGDLASQLGAQLAAGGLTVTGSTASGTQDLAIDGEGFLGFANAMTFTISIEMSAGMAMTVTQTHSGAVGANWAWDGSSDAVDTHGVMVFSDYNGSEYHVDNTVAINGQASSASIPIPSTAAGDVPLEVSCTADTLTTHPQGSPFTTRWHR
ncbi:hypothetical protein [Protaetiibacter larvae]|uniref:Ig-like domain-containing protein n=1 Tax=Protaetiibacter larvae TaxID=2592654 RepID=A0A5C1Y6J1_9MICO|nr:hypothetical protein [Protaetiibacter larvae]QEO09663.1 hypothetical protein FLP23_06365 [Protaetiibacter larvae]